ncbi:MAG TPA: peptide ABC transporter substrate-binding protein [Pyrinomonadaceae bacterium]|nr:peptide ABC transporter substrate-binding protein [Pyrinomonadaceae bacterium]
MKFNNSNNARILIAIVLLSSFIAGCTSSASSKYFGRTVAPDDNILRYVSGSEPDSLDPAVATGQPEARVMMALYDALIEYHPKTNEPMPGLAERWEVGGGGTEYLFHLRRDAKFSNGDPITAKDVAYSFRRAVSPELAVLNGYLSYYIKYVEPYNSGEVFVRDSTGKFLLKSDVEGTPAKPAEAHETLGADTEFHRYLDSPDRLTVPGAEKQRAELFEKDPKLKAAVEGKEFVAIKGEDIGVEAVDDWTFRIKLRQPAPYFIGLLGHQLFRIVHPGTVEKWGKAWTKPENIVTSGPFLLKEHRPYDRIVTVKNPGYWDAGMVRLDGIEFYPLDEATTMMNLYKAGSIYAMYNHTPPAAWNQVLRQYTDEYLNFPEVAIEYYTVNVKKPPMDNLKVRQAFSLAINREALAKFRKTTKPLVDFSPEGIFPKYEEARQKVYAAELQKKGMTMEQWKARMFDPAKARQLLTEAGFPVQQNGERFSVPNFPIDQVELLYNTAESNRASAEFIQAQWKQNLGLTVALKNMEWKTFLTYRKKLEFTGVARAGWVGDYMDPFTFLNLFYGEINDSSTGWSNPKYDQLLDEANAELDEMKRFEKLAEAEFMMIQDQPVLPLQTQATNWIKKPFVKGMFPNPGTLHAWKFVYIERDPQKWDTNVDNIMNVPDPFVDEHIARLMRTQVQFNEAKKGDAAGTAE